MQARKKEAGYTLIELLIVLVLIGLSTPVMLLLYQYAVTALTSREAEIRQIENVQFANRYVRNWWIQYADGYDKESLSNQQLLTQAYKIYWSLMEKGEERLEVTVLIPKDKGKPYHLAFRKDTKVAPNMWRLIWDTSTGFNSARSGALAEWPAFASVEPAVTRLYVIRSGQLNAERIEKIETSPAEAPTMCCANLHWHAYRPDQRGASQKVFAQTSFSTWPLPPTWIASP